MEYRLWKDRLKPGLQPAHQFVGKSVAAIPAATMQFKDGPESRRKLGADLLF
jgi:hypothetical protein